MSNTEVTIIKAFGKMPRKWSGVEKSKNENNTSLEVYINEGEMYQINKWVLKHKNIETGWRSIWSLAR